MAELGQSDDPAQLVPGNPAVLHETAWSMTTYADVLDEAAGGLGRLSTPDGCAGPAAQQFRDAFAVEPQRWQEAGQAYRDAASAQESHSTTLEWAQRQAADAVEGWDAAERATAAAGGEYDRAAAQPGAMPFAPFLDPGEEGRRAAAGALADARAQLQAAGDRAAGVVGSARDRAPEGPGFWERLEVGAAGVAANTGNIAASVGNALMNHPGDVAAMAGGRALAAVSATGLAGSVALDATGVGVLGGVPLGGASLAGIGVGVGVAGAGAIDLALNAASTDRVEPFRSTPKGPKAQFRRGSPCLRSAPGGHGIHRSWRTAGTGTRRRHRRVRRGDLGCRRQSSPSRRGTDWW